MQEQGGQAHTHRALLATEEQSSVASIHVGHADIVPVGPVELAGKGTKKGLKILPFPPHTGVPQPWAVD